MPRRCEAGQLAAHGHKCCSQCCAATAPSDARTRLIFGYRLSSAAAVAQLPDIAVLAFLAHVLRNFQLDPRSCTSSCAAGPDSAPVLQRQPRELDPKAGTSRL